MPLHQIDEHAPYLGMGTAYAPASLPDGRCRQAVGFTSARRGKMRLAPLLKSFQRQYGLQIAGTAVWLSSNGVLDRLVIASASPMGLYTTPLFNTWQYDERIDGQHSFYQLNAAAATSFGGTVGPLESVQFKDELILAIDGRLYRYYVNESSSTEFLYQLGIFTPLAPTVSPSSSPGNLTPAAQYSYLTTVLDEKGRESSPSPSVTVQTGSQAYNIVLNRDAFGTGGGDTSWRIYRQNPSSKTFNEVAQITLPTTTYLDTASEDTVNQGAPAPSPGENDPPGNPNDRIRGPSHILAVWKDRLVLNDDNNPSIIQISNADSATQFSSLPLPTNITDGLRMEVGGGGDNVVTGLGNLGSILAVFKRGTTHLLYGDDITSFIFRPQLERGCQNHRSIQRAENVLLFLSDDGVYQIGYESGYSVDCISHDIDDQFLGFDPTANPNDPQSVGRPASVQVQNAVQGGVTSFYVEKRYYLSFGDKTLVYDVDDQGWTDTGYGFVRTATRYFSEAPAAISGNAPETMFLTLGDQNPADYSTRLLYFTVADTPKDMDAPGSVNSRLVCRPIDPNPSQQAKKRVSFMSVYGSTAVANGTQIGTVDWYADGIFVGCVPIYKGAVMRRNGALFEVQAPPVPGEVIFPDMRFTMNDLSLENIVFEFSYLN